MYQSVSQISLILAVGQKKVAFLFHFSQFNCTPYTEYLYFNRQGSRKCFVDRWLKSICNRAKISAASVGCPYLFSRTLQRVLWRYDLCCWVLRVGPPKQHCYCPSLCSGAEEHTAVYTERSQATKYQGGGILFEKVCRTMKGCAKSFAMKCFVFLWCTCSLL